MCWMVADEKVTPLYRLANANQNLPCLGISGLILYKFESRVPLNPVLYI